ncbi:hypothetical protein MRB53_005002 [Persea americana]|uniref:Uncharacterized protein n=1 Tax=Persea americana TaxID=3435 RepID=A0ACC2MC14_PERAE|nr:hypothetical protein MRB53_005002 [Persea americana]
MWEGRLKDHHILTNVREVWRQLDTQDVDSFDWQSYDRYSDELENCVNEGDRLLFRSAVTMKRMKLAVATGMSTCTGIEELQENESVGRCKEYIWIKTAPPKRRLTDSLTGS